MTFSKSKVAIALALLASASAFAQTKAPEPDWTVAYNLSLTSDYRYRGISQTRFKPAVQGGVDLTHKSGFYVGAWGSTIKWIKDIGTIAAADTGSANLEIDLYGGYRGELIKDVGYDVGVLRYWYKGNRFDNLSTFNGWATPKADTTEIYGALTYGVVTAKYSHATTNIFGNADSKGSGYLDLSATFDMGNGWSVVPHVGSQRIKGTPAAGFPNSLYSYTDYALTVNKDLGNGFVVSGAVIDTTAKRTAAGVPAYAAPDGAGTASTSSKDLGKSGLVLSVKYNF